MNRTSFHHEVVVLVGSGSDIPVLESSGLVEVLNNILGGRKYWDLSALSADRHDAELLQYCPRKVDEGTHVFIGAASLTALLPGRIAQIIEYRRPVLGVALDHKVWGPQPAITSLLAVPKGKFVAYMGVGEDGLYNAALMACQIVGLCQPGVRDRLQHFLLFNNKPPQVSIQLPSETKEE